MASARKLWKRLCEAEKRAAWFEGRMDGAQLVGTTALLELAEKHHEQSQLAANAMREAEARLHEAEREVERLRAVEQRAVEQTSVRGDVALLLQEGYILDTAETADHPYRVRALRHGRTTTVAGSSWADAVSKLVLAITGAE